jgi:hypothetical protein
MYPSPIADHLPPDGKPFCLYTPGGNHWAEWYMNRHGSDPQLPKKSIRIAAMTVTANSLAAIPYLRLAPTPSKPVDLGAVQRAVNETPRGLVYDLLLMFAVGNAQLTTQGFTLLPRRTRCIERVLHPMRRGARRGRQVLRRLRRAASGAQVRDGRARARRAP